MPSIASIHARNLALGRAPGAPASGPAAPSTTPALALSIRQPWAWLICHAGKDIENRDWPTRFRGPLLIHAGKTMTRGDYAACCLFIAGMRSTWRLPAYDILRHECGGIVGQTEIVGCVTSSASFWFCGPYGFLLANSRPLPFHPCRGALSFFLPTGAPNTELTGANPDQ
jgi:hypothetical protein